MATLVWFRDDLRTADHAALAAAASDPEGVVCVFLYEDSPVSRPLGGAAKWWLHHSLQSLTRSLSAIGVPLILRRGPAEQVIPALLAETRVSRVVWNRRYGPEREGDARLKARLKETGIVAESFHGGLLHEPWSVQTGSGTPFRVYSPFWRAVLKLPEPAAPLAAPEILVPAAGQPRSDPLESWELTPTQPDWAGGLAERWSPGEHEALQRLDEFLEDRVDEYQARRNLPAVEATSELSPHLKWGEISPRTVWHRAIASGRDTAVFLSELGWREFAWHTRYHFGDLETTNLDARFDFFPWRDIDAEELEAWQQGHTGIPLVDGGMRELWQSGFMHNRVRMVVASFLTKHLLFDWRLGEAWFWDTLVDADAASNPFNWQWVAGCGLDASPYFRVFNPALQQQKFDPELQYIHHWAPDALLVPPMIELSLGRNRALAAFEEMKAIVPERR